MCRSLGHIFWKAAAKISGKDKSGIDVGSLKSADPGNSTGTGGAAIPVCAGAVLAVAAYNDTPRLACVVDDGIDGRDIDVPRRKLFRDALENLLDVIQFGLRERAGIAVDVIGRCRSGRKAAPGWRRVPVEVQKY